MRQHTEISEGGRVSRMCRHGNVECGQSLQNVRTYESMYCSCPQQLEFMRKFQILNFQYIIYHLYLLIVGSHYCVMRFAYALHMHHLNLVFFPCLYIELFELVIEVIFHYCTTPPCQKINLFKRPFRCSRLERLDDAFVLLVSLILILSLRKRVHDIKIHATRGMIIRHVNSPRVKYFIATKLL